jgi:putative endonuclease
MTHARQRTGRIAEDLAARRLRARGWRIVERNARTRLGELDIVALDRGCLVFVEVKAGRRGSHYGPERPVLAVGPRKQSRLRRLAAAWMTANRGGARFGEIRFDVIGVSFGRPGEAPGIEHLENAF